VKVIDEPEVEEEDGEESDDEDLLEGFESESEVDEAQLSLSLPAIPKPKQVSSVTQTSTDITTVRLSDNFAFKSYIIIYRVKGTAHLTVIYIEIHIRTKTTTGRIPRHRLSWSYTPRLL